MTTVAGSETKTIGIILAGGEGRRLGGVDKGLVNAQGRPLIEYVIDALDTEVDDILIIANRHHDSYASYGYQVIADEQPGFAGPLAGMLTGLKSAIEKYGPCQVIFAPVDAARLPDNYVIRLQQAAMQQLAVSGNNDGLQPVCCLVGSDYLPSLQQAFDAGERSPAKWLKAQSAALADFSDDRDCIWSINTPDELQSSEQAVLNIRGAAA